MTTISIIMETQTQQTIFILQCYLLLLVSVTPGHSGKILQELLGYESKFQEE